MIDLKFDDRFNLAVSMAKQQKMIQELKDFSFYNFVRTNKYHHSLNTERCLNEIKKLGLD